MNDLLIPALGLGIAYAATPGVVNTECIRRGMAHGFIPAFSVQAGALAGDAIWAALALSGFAALARFSSVSIALGIAGGLLFCNLAFKALRESLKGPDFEGSTSDLGHLRTGLVFGLANPAGLAFWAGVGGGLLSATGGSRGFGDYVAFLSAFTFGAVIWSAGLSALLSWGRRFAQPRLFRTIDAICGAVLGFFGIKLLWSAGRRLLKAI